MNEQLPLESVAVGTGPILSDLLYMDGSPVQTPHDWEAKRSYIRRTVEYWLGMQPSQQDSLNACVEHAEVLEHYTRYRVTYEVEAGERVSAYLLIPHDLKQPAPAVLCLHETTPYGKDEPTGLLADRDTAYAHDLAIRGYVTLAPDSLAAGERVVSGSRPYDTASFYEKHPQWSALGKQIWDNSRAIDFLLTRHEVDAARIGSIGHSLGGHASVFTAAFDERIRACVSNCGLTLFAENPQRRLEWARDQWYIYIKKLRPLFLSGAPAPFDFHEVVALVAPRACLNISAFNDRCYWRTDGQAELAVRINKLYRLLGAEHNFSTYLHGEGHSCRDDARLLAYTWLESKLRLDGVP